MDAFKQVLEMNKRITETRIMKQTESIAKEPIASVLVVPTELYNFNFCFYDLEEQFKGGFYHGVLELPQDYPFSPPKIKFLTNNGRFEVGKSICTSFTHYHRETWSSSWNIRTILTAMISFMYSNERGIGGIFQTSAKRRQLAKKSLAENLKDQKFVELFRDKLIDLKLVTVEKMEELISGKKKRKEKNGTRSGKNNQSLQQFQLIVEQGQEKRVQMDNGSESDTICRKRELKEAEDIQEFDILTKRMKLQEEGRLEMENEEVGELQRQKTVQQPQEQ